MARGLDFIVVGRAFDVVTFSSEGDRFSYGEQCFVTPGLLAGFPVSVARAASEHEVHIIPFRKTTHLEAQI